MALAKTTFATGPDDKEAVLDVYKKSDSSVYNGYQDTYNDVFTDKGLDALLKGQSDPKAASDAPQKPSTASTISRCCGGNKALRSLTQDLSDAAKNTFTVDNKLKDAISFNLGNVTSKILPKNLSDANAVIGLVNKLTNNALNGTLVDKGALSGLVTSLTRQATTVGLSGVFKAVSGTITDKSALMCSAGDLLPQAASSGNSKLFLEIANSSIGKQVKSIIPDVIGSVVKGLKLPVELQQQDYSKYYKDLSGGMRNVDKDWDKYFRVGAGLTNSSLNGIKTAASKDFIKLLKSNVFSTSTIPTVATSTSQVGFIGPFDPSTADPVTQKRYDDNNDKFLLLMDKYKTKEVGDDLKKMLPNIKVTPDPIYENLRITST